MRPLLARLFELPEKEHDAFLRDACNGDEELESGVRELFREELDDVRFLDPPTIAKSPAAARATDSFPAEGGGRIGAYLLVRRLGEGGMGTVWLADRDEDTFEQQVAIKVMKQGLHTQDLLARFETERQVLAWLEHPSISRIIDGGRLENGLPYLVMEYVDGVPIDRYCDETRLTVEARIELFLSVCDAVQHAHERGVIHRDLKPSNVLVDTGGRVRLLDFGIAKVLGAESAEETLDLTRTGQRLYSPHYASPEQVLGEPVGAASDVYSLGVVLYELLTGARPYYARSLSQFELDRVVCEEEPTRPSRVLRDVHAEDSERALGAPWELRGFEQARGLRSRLAGDLDWILLGALRKDAQRRYAGAAALADDLRRHLAGHPVAVRPESPLYRASRFTRRNRALVVSVTALLAVISSAFLVTLIQLGKTRTAEENASFEANIARLQAAEGALRDNDLAGARELLELVPTGERGWEWRHLQARQDRSVLSATIRPHTGERLGYDRGSGRFLVADSRYVSVFDPRTGEVAESSLFIETPRTATGCASFHPEGHVLVAALADQRARVLDAHTLELLQLLDVPSVRAVEFSPEGDRIGLVLESEDLVLVSWPELAVEHTLPSGVERPEIVRFSPDGRWIAVAGWSEDVHIFELGNGVPTLERKLSGHTMAINSVAFDAQSAQLVSGSLDQTVRVWSLVAPNKAPFVFRDHASYITSVLFHPLSGEVLSLEDNGTMLRWRSESGEIVSRIRSGSGNGALGITSDGSWVVASTGSGSLKVWSTDSDDVRRMYSCEFTSGVVFTPDGETVIASAPDGSIRRWRLDGEPLPNLRVDDAPLFLTSISGGPRIVALDIDGRVTTWDPAGEELSTDGAAALATSTDFGQTPVATTRGVLTAVAQENRILVHDSAQGAVVAETVLPHAGQRSTLAWIPGSEKLLVIEHRGGMWTWAPSKPEGPLEVGHLGGDLMTLMSIGFLRDGKTAVLASDAGAIDLFDVEQRTLTSLRESGTACTSVAAHPNEARFAVGYRDGSIGIWDPQRGRELLRLHGPEGRISSLAFSPDGAWLASASHGGWVYLWDTDVR